MNIFAAGLALVCGLSLPMVAFAGDIVNLNTVTEKQLLDLPTGLSERQVRALLQYRKERGGFATPDDVKQVPGLDEESFRHIYPFELNGTVVMEVEIPKGMSPY